MKKIITGMLLALTGILAVCIAAGPILGKGYFPMHDDTQVARVVEMASALKDGQFPVRMVRDLGYGYGYPLYSFYGPLPYYIGGAMHATGVGATDATKTMFVLGILLSGISMFVLGTYVFGPVGGFVAAFMYLFAPYHAVQIYVRGAVGEYYATAFLPLIILGALLLRKEASRRTGIVVGVVGISGAILSHTIYGYLVIGGLFAALGVLVVKNIVAREKDWLYVRYFFCLILVSLDMTAFFWLPAFVEMGGTSVAKVVGAAAADYRQHFVCLPQLWQSPWGFGGSAPGCTDGMSFKIGKTHLIAAAVGICAGYFVSGRRRIRMVAVVSGILGITAVLATLQVSSFVWALVPKAEFVQYPWRFLPFAVLFFSLAAGLLPAMSRRAWLGVVCAAVIVVGTGLQDIRLFVPQYMDSRGDGVMASPEDIGWRVSKISDEYLPAGFRVPKRREELPGGLVSSGSQAELTVKRDNSTSFLFDVISPRSQTITINRSYFPGWTVRVNGKKAPLNVVNGILAVVVSEGKSTVEGRLSDTPVRGVANVLSIVSVLGFILVIYGKKTHA